MHRKRLLAWKALLDAGNLDRRGEQAESIPPETTAYLSDEALARFTYAPTDEEAEVIERRREEARRILAGAA
jgi:hypothetical protein